MDGYYVEFCGGCRHRSASAETTTAHLTSHVAATREMKSDKCPNQCKTLRSQPVNIILDLGYKRRSFINLEGRFSFYILKL